MPDAPDVVSEAVLAAGGLPRGDYWVANDFVRTLRTITEIKARHRITLH
jgi:hypothetical protein